MAPDTLAYIWNYAAFDKAAPSSFQRAIAFLKPQQKRPKFARGAGDIALPLA